MIFHVTEQTASVVNRTYRIEADSNEEAIEALEATYGEDKDEILVSAETVQMNVEIIDATLTNN